MNPIITKRCSPIEEAIYQDGFQAGATSRDAEVAQLRELLNCYNLGGWTDSARLIKERDQLREQVNRLKEALGKHLTELMDIAITNGANSVSMPDEYVATALLLSSTPEQSLAEYRNKVIEECASYCDERAKKSYLSVEKSIAAGLRAMKEQP